MVSQNSSRGNSNFNTECAFGNAIKELKISQLLKASNITKARGASAYEVFQFLLIMVFQRCNLYHFLNSKKKDTACDDNTYYRFLNEGLPLPERGQVQLEEVYPSSLDASGSIYVYVNVTGQSQVPGP